MLSPIIAGTVFQCTVFGFWPVPEIIACRERIPDVAIENIAALRDGEPCVDGDRRCAVAAAVQLGRHLTELFRSKTGDASHMVTLFDGPRLTCTSYGDRKRWPTDGAVYARCEAEDIGDIGCALISRGAAAERRPGESGCALSDE